MEKASPFITLFTPAYNRKPYLLPLYDSIKQQAYRRFEWIIVDDGSTDGTGEEVAGFIVEGVIPVRYHFQENAGKHVAINKGVELANGELFFIVDSDDTLTPDALSIVAEQWNAVLARPDADRFAGVCGLRVHQDGRVIGGDVDYDVLDVSAIDYRFKLGYKGDRAEVVRTSIIAKFRYPSFRGERFCADALVWNRIALNYVMRFFNKGIYVCEYLPGGITDTSVKLRQNSPKGACLYYAEMAKLPGLTKIQRFKAALNYWRFAVYDRQVSFMENRKAIGTCWSYIMYPTMVVLKFYKSLSRSHE